MTSTFYHSFRPFLPFRAERKLFGGYTAREVQYWSGITMQFAVNCTEEAVDAMLVESQFPPEVYTAAESYFGLSVREDVTVAHVFAYQRAALYHSAGWPCQCMSGGAGEHIRAQDIRKDG